MGYPIKHIVGFDGQTYDIPTGGIKHLSFTEKSDDDRTVSITVPSDVNVGDVVILDRYTAGEFYFWPGTLNNMQVTIWSGSTNASNDGMVEGLDASYDYILICTNINSGYYTFRLISGGAPAVISDYRGTTGPRASETDTILHYGCTMGAVPIKKVALNLSQLTIGLNPSSATVDQSWFDAYAFFYNCGKYAIVAQIRTSASADVTEITVPDVLASWFRLNAPSFVQRGESSNQYGSYCTKVAAQKSTVDDTTHMGLYSNSTRWLIIVGDYSIAKP